MLPEELTKLKRYVGGLPEHDYGKCCGIKTKYHVGASEHGNRVDEQKISSLLHVQAAPTMGHVRNRTDMNVWKSRAPYRSYGPDEESKTMETKLQVTKACGYVYALGGGRIPSRPLKKLKMRLKFKEEKLSCFHKNPKLELS
ncbi:hypothetical protein Tco_0932753 [Tanacetum coccineum]